MRALHPSIRQFGRVALTATVLLTSLVATFEQGTVSATAEPAGSTSDAAEAVELDANMASTTLYGRDATVTLNAVNTTPSDAFNLSFSAVLPTSVAYVDGSSRVGDVGSGDPVVVRGADSPVLVWSNRSDLLAGASSSLSFAVRPDTSVHGVGDDIEVGAVAAANSDPRTVPDFDPVTGAPAADATSSAASAVSTRLSPFYLTVSEPSEERELLRGVHDHRTVVTVALDNNLVQSTTGFSITTHLPAGLEFLGCGDVDNSTPGTEEYSGAGPLNADGAPAMANLCLTPSSVSTLTVDPDGEGTLGRGTQTQLVWDASALSAAFGSADLDAGDSLRFDFVVAVPLRSNVEAELAEPTANLDNNTGPLTSDEQAMVVHGVATGDYAGALPSADEATETIVAEDVSVHVRTSTASIEQGGSTTWSLLVESSEYALTTGPITVRSIERGCRVRPTQASRR